MSQADLNRAVAVATGETVDWIERQGFSLLEVPAMGREPLVFDWDYEAAQLLGTTFD